MDGPCLRTTGAGDAQKIKTHLASVYRYNFEKDLSVHNNPQRPTYALGHEGGLLLLLLAPRR